jgi:hypothetical protein
VELGPSGPERCPLVRFGSGAGPFPNRWTSVVREHAAWRRTECRPQTGRQLVEGASASHRRGAADAGPSAAAEVHIKSQEDRSRRAETQRGSVYESRSGLPDAPL